MGFEDTKTEFFGPRRRTSWPGRAGRSRAKREARQLAPLHSSDPGERLLAATTLVERDIDSNAGVLLDFVREERNRDVRSAVSRAVLTAPLTARPARPEAKLRDWAHAELTRHAGQPDPASPPSLAPVSLAPDPRAPAPAPAPVSGRIPPVLSPDDRWRTGGAAVHWRLAPLPAPPLPPPVTQAPPAVVGGTVGNGSSFKTIVHRIDECAATAPEEQHDAEDKPATAEKPLPEPVAEPAPATWRVVKAHPVDIVVWEPADEAGDAAPNEEKAQSEPPVAR